MNEKSRYCVACDHMIFGDDADMMGRQTGDGFVCEDCISNYSDESEYEGEEEYKDEEDGQDDGEEDGDAG